MLILRNGDIIMRFILVRNLKGNEILAQTLFDGYGKILLPAGTKLNVPYVNRIRQSGFYYIYIKDEALDDIKYDRTIVNLKQRTVERLPSLFKNILNKDQKNIKESLYMVNELVSYIIKEGDINTNLYEINKYDNYTYVHCVDTGIMSIFLGRFLGLGVDDLSNLGTAAILHDIGKIQVPEKIINKIGVLEKSEFDEIKRHTIYGYNALKNAGITEINTLAGVLEHHEKVNGTGYPLGLTGDKINIFAKIVSVCDVFTALSANRSYRERFNPNEAYEFILSNINIAFDKEVVDKFKQNFSIYPLGACVKLSNGIEGFVIKQNKFFPDRPIIRVSYDHITRKKICPYELDLLTALDITINSIVG